VRVPWSTVDTQISSFWTDSNAKCGEIVGLRRHCSYGVRSWIPHVLAAKF
jgi:hypothetical protein